MLRFEDAALVAQPCPYDLAFRTYQVSCEAAYKPMRKESRQPWYMITMPRFCYKHPYALILSSFCTIVLNVRLILPAGSRFRLGTACIQ